MFKNGLVQYYYLILAHNTPLGSAGAWPGVVIQDFLSRFLFWCFLQLPFILHTKNRHPPL